MVWDDTPIDVENIRPFTAKAERVDRGRETEGEEGEHVKEPEIMREPVPEIMNSSSHSSGARESFVLFASINSGKPIFPAISASFS